MASDPTCPVCRTADIVCGKWTLLLVRDLAEGRSRFCELERSLNGISPRTLSLRLRALEEEGIVERQTYAEVPPRVEYSLTDKGRALHPDHRGHAHLRRALAGRRVRHRAGGGPRARRRRRLTQPSPSHRNSRRRRRVLGVWQEIVQALRPPARRATLAAVGGTTITRRRALVLGAAAGLGSLLARPFSALGRGAPARARGFGMAVVPGDFEGATSRVLRAPRRFDLLGVRGPDAARGRFEVRVRRRGGRLEPVGGARRPRRPRARHRHRRARLRSGLGRWLRRAAAARLAAAARRRCACTSSPSPPRLAGRRVARAAASPKQQAAPQPGTPPPIIPRAAWGADAVPPRAAPDYGVVQMAFVHHTVTANDYTPDQSASMVLAHRQVPPRHQRVERHRLQLPRRPVRAGLRRARGRGRPGGHRRPGAGLQLAVHRRRGARHLHRRADPRGRDGVDHAAARLEAHAARRAVRGRADDRLRRRQPEPLPVGDAGGHAAHLGAPRRRQHRVPRRRALRPAARAAPARGGPGRADRGPRRGQPAALRRRHRLRRRRRLQRARSSAPTRPPAPARSSRCRSAAPAARG